MIKRISWLHFLVLLLLFLMISHAPLLASPPAEAFSSASELILGREAGDMEFTVIWSNADLYGASTDPMLEAFQFQLKITYPDGDSRFVVGFRSGNSVTFYCALPYQMGRFQLNYFFGGTSSSPGAEVPAAEGSPTEVRVRPEVDFFISEPPKLDAEDLVITGAVTDKNNQAVTTRPSFTVRGASIAAETFNQGYFTLRLGRINFAGPDALQFSVNGVEIGSWDVASNPLAGYSFSPGALHAEGTPGISAAAAYWDSQNNILRDIEAHSLLISLSGVPIMANSVSGLVSSEFSFNTTETYDRISLTLESLRSSTIRFASSGTLKVTLSTQNYRYHSSFEIPVYSGVARDVFGAPAVQSYAGSNTLDLRFGSTIGRQVVQYWAELTLPDGSVQARQFSATRIDNVAPMSFLARGDQALELQLTAVERSEQWVESRNTWETSFEQWSVQKSFAYTLPEVILSQSVFPLGESATLSLTLKDEQGSLVSGANVSIQGIGTLRAVSGSPGEYEITSSWNTPGYLRLEAVSSEGRILARIDDYLLVQAPEVWRIEAVETETLAGVEQLHRFKVMDESGSEVRGNAARLVAKADYEPIAGSISWDGQYYTLRATAWSRLEVQAFSTDGRIASPILVIPARVPVATANLKSFSNGFRQSLEVSFTHPASGEALVGTVTLRGVNLDYVTRNAQSNGSTANSGSSFSWDIYPRVGRAGDTGMFIIDFTTGGRSYHQALSFDVSDPVITVSPARLRAGSQQMVTLTLASPDGTALPGVTVRAGASSEQKQTDEKGEVSFMVRVPTTGDFSFHIIRDDQPIQGGSSGSSFAYTVPVVRDDTPPKVIVTGETGLAFTVQENPYTLQLEFTDDFELEGFFLGVTRHALSGVEDNWSGSISLMPGVNEIVLTISDAAGNRAVERMYITYERSTPVVPPPTEPVGELPGDIPGQNGEAVRLIIGSMVVRRGEEVLDAPPLVPQIINGRTMLPFRYLVQTVLGGEVDYDAESRSITAYVSGRVVQMQVENEVMSVDGEEYTLSQAPLVINGSTLVPLRAFDPVVQSIDWDEDAQMVTIVP